MAGRFVKAGAPALLACADFWQPQVARAAAAALAALTEDAGAAVALMRATPADIEKSAGAPSMAAGGGGGLGALLTMVGSTDGATQLAALAAFGHVCAHPANTAALVRARALDRPNTPSEECRRRAATVALGVAALCERRRLGGSLRRASAADATVDRARLAHATRVTADAPRCAARARGALWATAAPTRAHRGGAAAVAAADLRGVGASASRRRCSPCFASSGCRGGRAVATVACTRARQGAAASRRMPPSAAPPSRSRSPPTPNPRSTPASRREIRGRRWQRRRRGSPPPPPRVRPSLCRRSPPRAPPPPPPPTAVRKENGRNRARPGVLGIDGRGAR